MSGYKRSNVALDMEREKKLRLLTEMGNARRQLEWLAAKIAETLDRAPGGIKETFDREAKQAAAWRGAEARSRTEVYSMATDIRTLTSSLSSLSALIDKGHATMSALAVSFTQKADALEKGLLSQFSQIESTYHAHKGLLDTWFGQEASSQYQASLSRAEQMLAKLQLSALGDHLKKAETDLTSRIQEATELEHKHQKRLYVLKALRQVCAEMGFEESEPEYERDGKRNRIIYEVDTLDRGRIRFFLSLDTIATQSGIAEDRCLDEFDKLSHHLQEEFGVKTKFRGEGDRQDPKLIQKGELDLPDSPQMESAA